MSSSNYSPAKIAEIERECIAMHDAIYETEPLHCGEVSTGHVATWVKEEVFEWLALVCGLPVLEARKVSLTGLELLDHNPWPLDDLQATLARCGLNADHIELVCTQFMTWRVHSSHVLKWSQETVDLWARDIMGFHPMDCAALADCDGERLVRGSLSASLSEGAVHAIVKCRFYRHWRQQHIASPLPFEPEFEF